jgi:hypothetical protein
MTKYKVVISYEVQKTFVLDAKNQDEAFDKADGFWIGDTKNDNYEYIEHIETEELNEEDLNDQIF